MNRILLLIILSSRIPAAGAVPQTERHALRLIVVRTEAEAAAVRSQLAAGGSFESLARQYSTDKSAESGGYIGVVAPGDLRREFQEALASLKPGEVTPVTRIGNEFALLQWLSEREESWIASNDAGLRALRDKRYPEAEKSFSAAIQAAEKFGPRDPHLLESIRGLGETYRAQEKYAEAEPLYRRILGIVWGPADVLDSFASLLSQSYFRDKQFDEEVKKYEQAIGRTPLSEDFYLAMNTILSRAELRVEAEALMTRAVKAFPNSRRIRYRFAELYRDSGKMKQALEIFKQASELEAPQGFDPLLDRRQRSFVFQRIGGINTDLVQFDDAMAAYKKAVEINPDNVDARLALGDSYLQRDRLDDALAEYTRAVASSPGFAPAHNRLAELNLRLGHFPESAAAASKALEIDPAHRRSSYVKAIALIRMGQNEEGEKELKQYEQLESEAQAEANRFREIAVINRGAAALFKDGHAEEAIAMFRQGIQSHPEATSIDLNLGTALSKLGRHREAIQTLQALVDRGRDNNVLVHRNLAREYQTLGDTKATVRHEVLYLQLMDATLEAGLN